jgi:exopolyphosphatase/guanosine-5'-triphosphate,3'-diphosphate pyrophosphatase
MGHIAVIDLGSNLTKLVVAKNTLPLKVVHRSVYDTQTLKRAPKGYFSEESIDFLEKDIQKILNVILQFPHSEILGIATSAFRTRSNGQEVLERLNQKFGTKIEIIEGQREAQLIFDGAIVSVPQVEFPTLVMDIGGGSTEFIIGNENGILWKHSFDFGSTAITHGIELQNPLSAENIEEITERIQFHLPELFEKIEEFQPVSFIGTTGAFESFAQLLQTEKGVFHPVKSGYKFDVDPLIPLLETIISSTQHERQKMEGLNPLRVPTIHVAAVIFRYVFEHVYISDYFLSLGDVKEGLVLERLHNSAAKLD